MITIRHAKYSEFEIEVLYTIFAQIRDYGLPCATSCDVCRIRNICADISSTTKFLRELSENHC